MTWPLLFCNRIHYGTEVLKTSLTGHNRGHSSFDSRPSSITFWKIQLIRLTCYLCALVLFFTVSSLLMAQGITPVQHTSGALEEMAAIERQIGVICGGLETEFVMIESTQEALDGVTRRLNTRTAHAMGERAVLDSMPETMESMIDDLAMLQDLDRRQFRLARERLRQGIAYYYQTLHSTPRLPLLQPSLMVWIDRHYNQVLASTDRILRQEQEMTGLAPVGSRFRGISAQRNVFTLYGVDLLNTQRESITKLKGRKAGLKLLIRQLAGEEALRGEEASGQGFVGDGVSEADEAIVDPSGPEWTRLISIPEVSLDPDEESVLPDRIEANGSRHLFWRAHPVAVRTPVGGRVVFAGAHAGYRHVLIIRHEGNRHTVMTNLIRSRIPVGFGVSAGERVGIYQAAYGARTLPFAVEFRWNAEPVSPSSWEVLAADWKAQLFAPVQ